jgi:hypothetical protein
MREDAVEAGYARRLESVVDTTRIVGESLLFPFCMVASWQMMGRPSAVGLSFGLKRVLPTFCRQRLSPLSEAET